MGRGNCREGAQRKNKPDTFFGVGLPSGPDDVDVSPISAEEDEAFSPADLERRVGEEHEDDRYTDHHVVVEADELLRHRAGGDQGGGAADPEDVVDIVESLGSESKYR